MLGPLAPLILSVPLALALRTALLRRWNGHLLLFLAVPAYVAAVSVMNTIYTHYFLPAVAALPLVVSAAVAEFEADAAPAGGWRETGWKDRAFMPFVMAVLCAAGLVVVAMQSASPVVVQQFYSRVYNLPAKNVWGMTWPVVAVFSLALTAVLAFANGRGTTPVKATAWAFAAVVAGSVAFAALPASWDDQRPISASALPSTESDSTFSTSPAKNSQLHNPFKAAFSFAASTASSTISTPMTLPATGAIS